MLMANCAFVSGGAYQRRLAVEPTPLTESGSGSTLTFTKPAGTVETDFLVTLASAIVNGTWTEASGFTEAYQANNSQIAYKTAGSSEPSTYDFTKSGGGGRGGTILRVPGGSFGAVGTLSSTSGSPVAPAITMPRPGLLIAWFRRDLEVTAATYSTPSGMDPLVALGSFPSFAVFTEQVGAGDTGTRTSTASEGTNHRGVLLGIIPA